MRRLDRATIDEVQRVPELLLAIKKSVDDNYRPGRFLLTGSSNLMTLPRVADSLAGRVETIRLLPLARGELLGRSPSFLEDVFEGRVRNPSEPVVGDELIELVPRNSSTTPRSAPRSTSVTEQASATWGF